MSEEIQAPGEVLRSSLVCLFHSGYKCPLWVTRNEGSFEPPKSQGGPRLDPKSKTLEQISSGEWRLNGPQG